MAKTVAKPVPKVSKQAARPQQMIAKAEIDETSKKIAHKDSGEALFGGVEPLPEARLSAEDAAFLARMQDPNSVEPDVEEEAVAPLQVTPNIIAPPVNRPAVVPPTPAVRTMAATPTVPAAAPRQVPTDLVASRPYQSQLAPLPKQLNGQAAVPQPGQPAQPQVPIPSSKLAPNSIPRLIPASQQNRPQLRPQPQVVAQVHQQQVPVTAPMAIMHPSKNPVVLAIQQRIAKDPSIIDELRDVFFPWQGRQICICMPSYKDMMPMTALSLFATALDLGKSKMAMQYRFGDAMIVDSRNYIADQFINETQAEWSLWLDDDVIPPFGRPELLRKECGLSDEPSDPYFWSDESAGMNWVERLLSHGQTFVGATYFSRRRFGTPMAGDMDQDLYNACKNRMDMLHSVDWVGTGAMLVHRNVFLAIRQAFPELAPVGKREWWDYFRKEDSRGEDVAFSHRARAAGHNVWLDTACQCLHVGYMAYGCHNVELQQKPSGELF